MYTLIANSGVHKSELELNPNDDVVKALRFWGQLSKVILLEFAEYLTEKLVTRDVDKTGTFITNPENAGIFYHWNHKFEWKSTGSKVSKGNVDIYDGTAGEKSNDLCPIGWRLSIPKELETFFDYYKVRLKRIIENGIEGRDFTLKVSGNSNFYTSTGYRYTVDGKLSSPSLVGRYLSSTQGRSKEVYFLLFFTSEIKNFGKEDSFDYCIRSYNNRPVSDYFLISSTIII